MKVRAGVSGLAGICAALLLVWAAPAQAERALQSEALLQTSSEAEVEDACGLAVAPSGSLYVSDYYHGTVDVFESNGRFISQLLATKAPEGPCGLAFDTTGTLYANVYHQRAVRFPGPVTIDNESSTGVAVDPATNRLYVDDRTYVAVYEPSGEAVLDGLEPLRIGAGSLGDAYGVAAFGGRVYVADAGDDTLKIFKPELSTTEPIAKIKTTPTGHFVSLVDSSLTVDPSNGHLLLVDDTQPGFEHPKAAIYEFKASGGFLSKLAGSPVDGEPSGIAVASDGTLYVTNGNSEEANVFKYGPYEEPGGSAAGPPREEGEPSPASDNASSRSFTQSASAAANEETRSSKKSPSSSSRNLKGQTELVQKGPIRVAVSGGLAPTRLPREGTAPISVRIGGHISSTDPSQPPQLRKVTFAFNSAGRLDTEGLPRCALSDIDPSSTRQALQACHRSVLGEGQFTAKVLLPEQSPFPSQGKVIAFNGALRGKPVIFAHVYGTKPVPTSVVLPLYIRQARGTFGTQMEASLAKLTGDWGYVTGIELKLGRKWSYRGKRRSFLSAGCPAPKGFPGVLFPLAKTTFSFGGERKLSATLTRSCTVRG